MKAIALIRGNNVLGVDGGLLEDNPKADLKQFQEKTSGHVVIMGRKTLDSLPWGQPLKNRTNVILTRDKTLKVKDCIVVNGLDALKDMIFNFEKSGRTVWLIGGGEIYNLLLENCDELHLTKVYDDDPKGDTFFPELGDNWKITSSSKAHRYGTPRGIFSYCYETYSNSKITPLCTNISKEE